MSFLQLKIKLLIIDFSAQEEYFPGNFLCLMIPDIYSVCAQLQILTVPKMMNNSPASLLTIASPPF